LNIEDAYLLKRDHLKGSEVRLLNTDTIEFINSPFIVSTEDRRHECVRILKQAVAAGVELTPEIVYPNIVNEDKSNKIYGDDE
jgi:hypothetical protein